MFSNLFSKSKITKVVIFLHGPQKMPFCELNLNVVSKVYLLNLLVVCFENVSTILSQA